VRRRHKARHKKIFDEVHVQARFCFSFWPQETTLAGQALITLEIEAALAEKRVI
jgi:hypothetical protein